jgi:hypothetical protein
MTFDLTFVGVGPQRTASTWLYEMLRLHPSVVFPKGVKETQFFDRHFHKGFSWYEAHFAGGVAGSQIRGEISPTYFDDEAARERLRSAFPNLKVIVSLRNPVERAFSLYRLERMKGRVAGDFREATARNSRIITSGHYAEHCPKWERDFGSDRVLYLLQEEIRSNPQEALDRVYDFLGIPRVALPATAGDNFSATHVPRYPVLARVMSEAARFLRRFRLHWLVNLGKKAGFRKAFQGGQGADQLTPELRNELGKIFEQDIRWVERKLGRELPEWRAGQPR